MSAPDRATVAARDFAVLQSVSDTLAFACAHLRYTFPSSTAAMPRSVARTRVCSIVQVG